MKRKIYILILLLPLLLCSCEKREFGIKEISASSLTGVILDESDLNMIVAIYNDEDPNYKQFLSDLDKIAKETSRNIYIIDGEHIDIANAMILYDGLQIEYEKLIYIVYQDGAEVIYNYYADYNTTLYDLEGYKSIYEIETSKYDTLDTDQYINEAREKYNAGYISEAYEKLNKIWPSEKAKEEYKNNKYYQIINNWEMYRTVGDNKIIQESFIFTASANVLYVASKEGELNNIENITMNEYTTYYYYIKDGIIYISESKDGKYKKGYTIESINEDSLVIKNNKYTYNLYPDL